MGPHPAQGRLRPREPSVLLARTSCQPPPPASPGSSTPRPGLQRDLCLHFCESSSGHILFMNPACRGSSLHLPVTSTFSDVPLGASSAFGTRSRATKPGSSLQSREEGGGSQPSGGQKPPSRWERRFGVGPAAPSSSRVRSVEPAGRCVTPISGNTTEPRRSHRGQRGGYCLLTKSQQRTVRNRGENPGDQTPRSDEKVSHACHVGRAFAG